MKFTCKGDVRGDCGIVHRSLTSANRCCEKDTRNVKIGNGDLAYSDRKPYPLDDEAREFKTAENELWAMY